MTNMRLLIWPNRNEPSQTHWCLFSEETLTEHGKSLTQLPKDLKTNKIIWIIPSEDVLLTHVILPKMSKNKLRLALPFALEEQLIADISELHFATGKIHSDQPVPVAIISKEKLNELFIFANQTQLFPTKIIPDIFTLPTQEKNWTVYIDENARCIVRTGKYSGFTSELIQLSSLLTIAHKEAQLPPERIDVLYTQKNQSSFLPNLSETIIDSIEINFDALQKQTITALTHSPFINLAQGAFQNTQKNIKTKKTWYIATRLMIIWLILLFTSQIIHIFILKKQNLQLDQSIHSIYYRYFPTAKNMVAPKLRLQEKLSHLNNDQNQNIFLSLLATISTVITKNTDIQIEQIYFSNKTLQLMLTANSFNALDMLTNQLKETHLNIKQQNASTINHRVQANFLIQEGAA